MQVVRRTPNGDEWQAMLNATISHKRPFLHLDGLRAILAIWVVLFHYERNTVHQVTPPRRGSPQAQTQDASAAHAGRDVIGCTYAFARTDRRLDRERVLPPGVFARDVRRM